MSWTCPNCGRSFGQAGQWHSCRMPEPLADWLAARPPLVASVLAAVRFRLDEPDIRIEATSAALTLKRVRTFAEITPRRAHVDLGFILSRRLDDPRIVRTLGLSARRVVHVLVIRDPLEVDDAVGEWLREAWRDSPE